jgi:hypothetical protein
MAGGPDHDADPARAWWSPFDATRSFTHYCLLAWHLALIPSIALVLVAHWVVTAAGADVAAIQRPAVDPERRNLWIALTLAPLIETAVLGLLLHLLGFVTRRPNMLAALSALCWGAAHAALYPMWFFGTVWSFFVFSRGWLAWRPVSYKHAFGAAAVPHALVNASAVLVQFFARS